MNYDPKRLLIATPVYGRPEAATVSYAYHTAVRVLERSGSVILPADLTYADDLVRARSQCAWWALQRKAAWDAVLWWDEDVVVQDVGIIDRMMATEHDVIGAPYPRKRLPACFPYKPLTKGATPIVNACIEVQRLSFGFMITTRNALETMARHYSDEWYSHEPMDGTPVRRVIAMFKQVHTPEANLHRELLGEDYSFCERWRATGGKVHMFVGQGAPLGHQGPFVFTGEPAELGRAL